MGKYRKPFISLINWLAIVGNMLFVFWILYNGITESFQGNTIETISYLTLMGLLTTNAILLLLGRKRKIEFD
jgi:hypothetical protein